MSKNKDVETFLASMEGEYEELPTEMVVPTTEDADSTSSDINYYWEQNYPTIKAAVFSREPFERQFPTLSAMAKAKYEFVPDSLWVKSAQALVVAQKDFPGLFFDADLGKPPAGAALVFYLPHIHEAFVAGIAEQKPDYSNEISSSLKYMASIFYWSYQSDTGRLTVSIYDSAAYRAIEYCDQVPGTSNKTSGYTPVVVIAGRKVAIGGFWFDERDDISFQATGVTAVNYSENEIFSEEELAEARKESSSIMLPVLSQELRVDGRSHSLHLPAFDCIEWSTNR
jgi:hypothetical protein